MSTRPPSTTTTQRFPACVALSKALCSTDPSYPRRPRMCNAATSPAFAPGAWEALAAARFQRPGLEQHAICHRVLGPYDSIAVRRLVVGGECDKNPATGVGGRDRGSDSRRRSLIVPKGRSLPADEQRRLQPNVARGFSRRPRCMQRKGGPGLLMGKTN